jgi:hypothetical protein
MQEQSWIAGLGSDQRNFQSWQGRLLREHEEKMLQQRAEQERRMAIMQAMLRGYGTPGARYGLNQAGTGHSISQNVYVNGERTSSNTTSSPFGGGPGLGAPGAPRTPTLITSKGTQTFDGRGPSVSVGVGTQLPSFEASTQTGSQQVKNPSSLLGGISHGPVDSASQTDYLNSIFDKVDVGVGPDSPFERGGFARLPMRKSNGGGPIPFNRGGFARTATRQIPGFIKPASHANLATGPMKSNVSFGPMDSIGYFDNPTPSRGLSKLPGDSPLATGMTI